MGAIGHDGLTVPGRVELAHEPAFQLGTLWVEPATRQVVGDGRQQSVEPRVMQVLVSLARARGAIVTRDELTAWCWDNRIVGDDSINRTLSRVRHIAADIGQGSFQVETITKVGYRLVERPAASAAPRTRGAGAPPQPRQLDRRALVAGALALAAAGAGAWWLGGPFFAPRIDPQARALFERGMEANRQGWVEAGDQAESYFQQAVAIDPDFADAWGALALQMQMGVPAHSDELAVAYRSRSAARRALALDPGQREARVALAMLPTWYRRWDDKERSVLALLDDYPEFPALTLHYASVLAQAARFDDSVTMLERTRSHWPFAPDPANQLIYALCGAGRLVEAEALAEQAILRWPRHPAVWQTRMALLTYSGRGEAALAFAADRARHPRGIEQMIPAVTATARALAYRRPDDIEAAIAETMKRVSDSVDNIPAAVRLFTALGDRDRCFALLGSYLFRRGPHATGAHPLSPFSRIFTDQLFHPYSLVLWPDPRFAAITRETGLDAYWKGIGFVPAFRR